MSMTAEERVARAICIADLKDPDEDFRDTGTAILKLPGPPGMYPRWRAYYFMARAAIEEMNKIAEEKFGFRAPVDEEQEPIR